MGCLFVLCLDVTLLSVTGWAGVYPGWPQTLDPLASAFQELGFQA